MLIHAVILQGTYYEAACKSIDTVRKEVVTCFPAFVKACEVKGAPMPCCTPGCGPHLPDHCAGFRIPYDILIVGVRACLYLNNIRCRLPLYLLPFYLLHLNIGY